MALNAAIVFEIRQGGSDTNGGGFKAGATGTDWSQQDAAQYSVTDGVTAGTTTITSATAAFGTDVVGNLVYVQGGTGSVAANWYEITARGSTTSITVDRATGLTAGTGVTLKIGGALGTPGVLTSVAGGVGGQLVGGQKAWVKYNATPYNCSSSTAGPSGPCSLPSVAFILEGYDVTRGDRTGNLPSYQWSAVPGALTYAFTLSASALQQCVNLQADGNSKANAGGFNLTGSRASVRECSAIHCNQTGARGFQSAGSSNPAIRCLASDCTVGFAGGSQVACTATGNTAGFVGFSGPGAVFRCLAYSIPTGFANSFANGIAVQCTADSCSTSGFNASGVTCYDSCLATNSGVGFNGAANASLVNCAAYNNTTHVSGTPGLNEGPFASGSTLTSLGADPYVNQAGGDFRPNANSPGGAQLRGTGVGVYGQTNNADIGAVQHTDPAGGGTTYIFGGEF